jgi:signal transduction histidine kinase
MVLFMLHEFLTANRRVLIARCRAKVALRRSGVNEAELDNGITTFLDQVIRTLAIEQTQDPMQSRKVSGPSGGLPVASDIGSAAARHGGELLNHGFSLDQVVHDYGDLCQAVTELAVERDENITTEEFGTLNRCLDNAIADAVNEYAYLRDTATADASAGALNERLGVIAHDLRDRLNTATLALSAIKSGHVGLAGATGAVLDRSLLGLRSIIDRSLADVRLTAGMAQHKLTSLAAFIAEVAASATLEAQSRECTFTVSAVDPRLAVDADLELLFSAVGNLLHNAFKFTKPRTEVVLNAYAVGDRILIDVKDSCGGLPPGAADRMFLPFTQAGEDRSGLGLGLSICKRSVEANHGTLSVRDEPGCGCIFTINLPRHAVPERRIALAAAS